MYNKFIFVDVKNTVTESSPSTSTSALAPIKEPVASTGVKIVEEILKKDAPVLLPQASTSGVTVSAAQKRKSLVEVAQQPPKENEEPAAQAEHHQPELKKEEHILNAEEEDYDTKTLKPQSTTEWECNRCTLLNPNSSNICAVCASVRNRDAAHKNATAKRVKKKAPQPKTDKDQHYLQLINLDNADLVENVEAFECVICYLDIPPGGGVTLRECLHQFCKMCLKHTIEYAEDAQVMCPYRDEQYSCDTALQDREIKALVPVAVYDQYLAKSVAQAENKMDKSFHCKTPDCKGWCIFEDNVNEFRCPVCRRINCLTCQVIFEQFFQLNVGVSSCITNSFIRLIYCFPSLAICFASCTVFLLALIALFAIAPFQFTDSLPALLILLLIGQIMASHILLAGLLFPDVVDVFIIPVVSLQWVLVVLFSTLILHL